MTDITLLDGSIGQELVRLSGDRATPLWSTSVMMHQPDLVRQVHDAYFAAGASVATTNTYAVLRDRLETVGLAGDIHALTRTALDMAKAARDAHGGGRLAGAIGPLVASYRPETCPPPDEAARDYAESINGLKNDVDVLLFETMASVEQAEGALLAAKDAGLPVWLAVSVADTDGTKLRSGEDLADLAPLIARNAPAAVLINCSPPEVIAAGLDILVSFGVPFGAYANGFTEISEGFLKDRPTVDALERRSDLGPQIYADLVLGWIAQGATIVGGCCEIGPDYIAEIARRLRAERFTIV